MFIVIEIQKNSSGQIATLVNAYDNHNTAEQKYHTVLAAASVSGLPSHAAVMLLENGQEIKHECYGAQVLE